MFRNLAIAMFSISLILLPNSDANAIAPPDNSSTSHIELVDSIKAYMSNVDDFGLVIMWNGTGAETVVQCQWTSGGNHGAASESLDRYLTKGDNYVIFALYNRVYGGTGIFAGGKWSYNFRLTKNGESVWRNSDHVRENDAELKYWKVFKMTVASSGGVSITDRIDPDVLRLLRSAMADLESKLDRSAGIATPF